MPLQPLNRKFTVLRQAPVAPPVAKGDTTDHHADDDAATRAAREACAKSLHKAAACAEKCDSKDAGHKCITKATASMCRQVAAMVMPDLELNLAADEELKCGPGCRCSADVCCENGPKCGDVSALLGSVVKMMRDCADHHDSTAAGSAGAGAVPSDDQSATDAEVRSALGHTAKRFDVSLAFKDADSIQSTALKGPDGHVLDYRDVKFTGYLSTFTNMTPADRQGDTVVNGAFAETIARFKLNPMMLRDHYNSTENVAGSFDSISEDAAGLKVIGRVSNSPQMINARFDIVEKHLRTMSMGGIFHYNDDGRTIFKVDLWEGSLTPIPANPDARINTRALTRSEVKRAKSFMQVAAQAGGGRGETNGSNGGGSGATK